MLQIETSLRIERCSQQVMRPRGIKLASCSLLFGSLNHARVVKLTLNSYRIGSVKRSKTWQKFWFFERATLRVISSSFNSPKCNGEKLAKVLFNQECVTLLLPRRQWQVQSNLSFALGTNLFFSKKFTSWSNLTMLLWAKYLPGEPVISRAYWTQPNREEFEQLAPTCSSDHKTFCDTCYICVTSLIRIAVGLRTLQAEGLQLEQQR